ncbi:hypothetical protein [Phosphitispora fastidiosa]|uniref:hypothetical protein n=1 Tax=Phosphitispora fastidiosa TaxID=2837202 RepID=UPI001E652F7D|nr:hypothetical protein [Phosphitispora fastidiosa]MBU7007179.1 hypothetical protein [Phosphitispora fastidiosa]
MCISVVIALNADKQQADAIRERVRQLGESYGYGIAMGKDKLLPGAGEEVFRVLSHPEIIFEVHDPAEPHCACDIDHDIRIASKLGERNRFFDFVGETLDGSDVKSVSVLFFQDELPNGDNVRKLSGTYEDFVITLNTWHTWQVAGFEPTREAHFIADESPLLFTFTDKRSLQ